MASISGSLTYRERIMLPPTAMVEVTLSDVARMDAPADVIATTTFPAHGGPPFSFVLDYDPTQLTTRGRYAVRATIRADGRLLFTSTEHIPAFDLDPERPIVLSKVGGRPRGGEFAEPTGQSGQVPGKPPDPEPTPPEGTNGPDVSLVNTYWRLAELDGAPAPLGAGGREVHLVLEQDSSIARGFAGCNTFRGTYETSGSGLSFGPLATTRKMCAEGMELEKALLAALDSVATFEVRSDRLMLGDRIGNVRVVMQSVALT